MPPQGCSSGRTSGQNAIYWEKEGEGAPVLLLHELGGTMRSWDAARSKLVKDFTVVAIDQRGAGQSAQVASAYGLSDQMDDVLAVMQEAGIDRPAMIVAVAASSFVAVSLAAHHPDMVCGLVLCSPSLAITPQQRETTLARARQVRAEGMARLVDGAMAALFPEHLRDARFPSYLQSFLEQDAEAYARASEALAQSECDPAMVRQPSLILAGDCDFRPVEQSRRLADGFCAGSFAVVPGAGHVPHFHAPGSVATLITRFAQEIRR
jgi:3-oxoadipate enol-lactonase